MQFDSPLEYDTIEVTAPTSLALVADITDTSMAQLLDLNPAVIHGNTVPAGYSVHVPKGTGNQLMAALQLIPSEHRDSWGCTACQWAKRWQPLANATAPRRAALWRPTICSRPRRWKAKAC